eukprot:CAMPEP_0194525432 /NCGR_PEP_ID=MMETSP0253-20130528/60891_1 /TAXON_ID=2966 /ORGANISM="Noctiluca scintillans" /LENGTH=704 /DNA_ID=CAMNT_0039370161 /DNA_START=41 /DNA_END=2153 /DNA_ORIENTATION=+
MTSSLSRFCISVVFLLGTIPSEALRNSGVQSISATEGLSSAQSHAALEKMDPGKESDTEAGQSMLGNIAQAAFQVLASLAKEAEKSAHKGDSHSEKSRESPKSFLKESEKEDSDESEEGNKTKRMKKVVHTSNCSLHSGCAGLPGDCCPTDSGRMLGCCYSKDGSDQEDDLVVATCFAYPACKHLPGDCCPDEDGEMLACCLKSHSFKANNTNRLKKAKATKLAKVEKEKKVKAGLAGCLANPGCAGLEGDCCPNTKGKMLECCHTGNWSLATEDDENEVMTDCSAFPRCAKLTGECCPTEWGERLDCCPSDLPAHHKTSRQAHQMKVKKDTDHEQNTKVVSKSALCSAHRNCKQLSGKCCPTSWGERLACCTEPDEDLSQDDSRDDESERQPDTEDSENPEDPEESQGFDESNSHHQVLKVSKSKTMVNTTATASLSSAACKANPKCKKLTGDCCPTSWGERLNCCPDFEEETVDETAEEPEQAEDPEDSEGSNSHHQVLKVRKSKTMVNTTTASLSSAACKANPKCTKLAGDCCPTSWGERLNCCPAVEEQTVEETAQEPEQTLASTDHKACAMHPKCDGMEGDCCPTSGGLHLGCCSSKAEGDSTTKRSVNKSDVLSDDVSQGRSVGSLKRKSGRSSDRWSEDRSEGRSQRSKTKPAAALHILAVRSTLAGVVLPRRARGWDAAVTDVPLALQASRKTVTN